MKYFLLCALLCVCDGAKILAIFPAPTHSHHKLALTLVEELAKRNHEVTFVSPFPLKTSIKNLKEISLETKASIFNEQKKQLFSLTEQSFFENVKYLTNMGYILTEETLKHKNMQALFQTKEQFDLIILPQFLTEALLGVAQLFKAPVVLLSPMPLFPWNSVFLGLPAPSSYVPNIFTQYTSRMNFWERLCNSFYDIYSIVFYKWVMIPKHQDLAKKYIPGEPDIYNIINNYSLLLINSDVSSYEAMIQVPNVVEIGGFHLKEPKKLPHDLETFLNQSVNGVLVFSMGSNLKTSNLPQVKKDAILNAFSKLQQNVLWKWETEEMPGQPKNVKLMKWLPQSDVLAHPNVKAFITHGGLLSTMESIYNGIPIIGIPVFADQKTNMATAVSHGYGEVVSLQELTKETLSSALDKVLKNPQYKNNAMKRSKIMRDKPIKPLDNGVYWIEYVMRHHGALHLRYPGTDLAWYQRNLLDVVAFALVVNLTITCTIFFSIRTILRNFLEVADQQKKND